jgi:hypothetical protein
VRIFSAMKSAPQQTEFAARFTATCPQKATQKLRIPQKTPHFTTPEKTANKSAPT